jgi:hypothetical protein
MYKSIKGTVLFVDILGFGALTNHEFQVSSDLIEDFNIIYHVDGLESENTTTNQLIAAWTLSKFREILNYVNSRYPTIEIAQLSDCAFLWSDDHSAILKAANLLMWRLLTTGIMARGGLASGTIIVHKDTSPHLGKFILGDAATRAVALEGKGKGCRIFTDSNSVALFHQHFPGKKTASSQRYGIMNQIFAPITNPLDFSVTDEFKWYLYADISKLDEQNHEFNPYAESLTMGYLICLLRSSPYFAWNCATNAGVIHVAASLDFISAATEIHGADAEQVRYTAETFVQILPTMPRKSAGLKNLFKEYSVDLLPERISKQLYDKAVSNANESLQSINKSFITAD